MNEEEKIRNLKSIKKIEEVNIDNDRLILYVVNLLEEMKLEPTFDKVSATAFKLFPSRFSLIGFEEYPDSKRVHDCLFHCTYKPKNWISGNAQSGYRITDKGKYFLREAKKILKGEINLSKKYSIKPKRKELTFINLLKKTTAFKKYSENHKDEITKNDLTEALRVYKDSPELIKKHLDKYYEYANAINDPEILDFLEFVKKQIKAK